jgi:hypothetical protein
MNWKGKILHEMAEYLFNVIYLTLVFAAFTQYRRLLLAAHDIVYTNYWVAVIQALIFGKVIMIGALFRLGRSLEEKPLIFPTLYKAVVFTFLVVVFHVVEHALKSLWQGNGLASSLTAFLDGGYHEVLAGALVIFVALIPFFAVKELGRVLGQERIGALFFRKHDPADSLHGQSADK